MSSRDKKPLGIKLSIETKGCSGLSQYVELMVSADQDEVLNVEDVVYIVDPAVLFLLGQQWIMRVLESVFTGKFNLIQLEKVDAVVESLFHV